MAKVTTVTVQGLLTNPTSAANNINSNFDAVAAAIENTLSRDGTTPNQMLADLDMNNNDISNVGNLGVDRIDAMSVYIDGVPVVPGSSGGGGGSSTVTSVAGRTGDVVLTKTDVGLGSVDNTSDINKPVSIAQQDALDLHMVRANNLSDVNNVGFALLNLGGTATGIALFTAVDAAAGRSAIAASPLASPTFTGVPAAPTAAPGTNTTQLASTAFVTAAVSALSGVYQPINTALSSIAGSGTTGMMARVDGNTVTNRTITAGIGLAVTNGSGVSGNPTIGESAPFTALTSGTTVSIDFTTSKNFGVTLNVSGTLANNSGTYSIGQTGYILVNQDATGSRTWSYGSDYKWAAGTPGVLSTGVNAQDMLKYTILGNNRVLLELVKGIA